MREVEDGGDGDVGIAEDLVELSYVDGADTFDPGDSLPGAEGVVGEVDEEASAAAEHGQLAGGE